MGIPGESSTRSSAGILPAAATVALGAVALLWMGVTWPPLAGPLLAVVGVGWLDLGAVGRWSRRRQAMAAMVGLGGAAIGVSLHLFVPPDLDELSAEIAAVAPAVEAVDVVSVVRDPELPWVAPVVEGYGVASAAERRAAVVEVRDALESHGYDVRVLDPDGDARAALWPEDRAWAEVWDLVAERDRTRLAVAFGDEGTAVVRASWDAPLVGSWPYEGGRGDRWPFSLVTEASFAIGGFVALAGSAILSIYSLALGVRALGRARQQADRARSRG